MKKRIMTVVLACLMVAGMVGMIAGADSGVTLPDDKFVAPEAPTSAVTEELPGTTAAIIDDPTGGLAQGIVFKAETGVIANTYTGYISGIKLGASHYDFVQMLEEISGISVLRETADGTIALRGDTLMHGDKVVLHDKEGNTTEELSIIFMGNADKNDIINVSDVSMALKIIANWDVDADEVAADVNGDGVVNLSDVTLMLQKVAGWDVEFVKEPVLPGKYDMVYKKDLACHKKNPTGGWAPLTLSDGVHWDLAAKFVVAKDEFATQIGILCHSLSDNEGSLRISIYKWKGDYDTTVAAMPIITEEFVDYTDNTVLIVDTTDTSGKGLMEGEYLWRVHEGYDDPDKATSGVGVYYFPNQAADESTGIKTFLNCKEFNIGPVANIFYASAYTKTK